MVLGFDVKFTSCKGNFTQWFGRKLQRQERYGLKGVKTPNLTDDFTGNQTSVQVSKSWPDASMHFSQCLIQKNKEISSKNGTPKNFASFQKL